MSAIWQSTRSKPPSGKGNAATSPSRQSRSGATRRATVSMASFRSTPTTRPAGATRPAAVRATMPVPQATSSTSWPGPTSAAAHSNGAHWAKKPGTKASS